MTSDEEVREVREVKEGGMSEQSVLLQASAAKEIMKSSCVRLGKAR